MLFLFLSSSLTALQGALSYLDRHWLGGSSVLVHLCIELGWSFLLPYTGDLGLNLGLRLLSGRGFFYSWHKGEKESKMEEG